MILTATPVRLRIFVDFLMLCAAPVVRCEEHGTDASRKIVKDRGSGSTMCNLQRSKNHMFFAYRFECVAHSIPVVLFKPSAGVDQFRTLVIGPWSQTLFSCPLLTPMIA
ncbi:hypothetical protein Aduo_005295 [Ancylostoma duodenale]